MAASTTFRRRCASARRPAGRPRSASATWSATDGGCDIPSSARWGGDLAVEAVNADLEKDLRYYNDERPHAGIGMMTPNERYAASSELPEESEMS